LFHSPRDITKMFDLVLRTSVHCSCCLLPII
jgi:hypothetical protein